MHASNRFGAAAVALIMFGCEAPNRSDNAYDDALLLSMAALGENDDGSPKPLPGRVGVLTYDGTEWGYRYFEDGDSNVVHKAMAYQASGVLTFGGTKAAVKLRSPSGGVETLWEADFGGKFSRMRDAEVGDIYGDGTAAIAVATHDQGVVAVLKPDGNGGFSVEELDREPNTVVHEIELGDLDGDGTIEIYATPTAPNKLDGTPQAGRVVRYVPATSEGRVEVADLGNRHAKEILVADIDGDGRDELYVSVEGVAGGSVEIRRYDADTDPAEHNIVATIDDRLCRFLTAGDVDGDGTQEIVAATNKKGLWLLRLESGDRWSKELIASDSSGFEHASILLDLDGDGRDELYVASDDQKDVRRYRLTGDGSWEREVLWKHEDELSRFTWNLMPVPIELVPLMSASGETAAFRTRPAISEYKAPPSERIGRGRVDAFSIVLDGWKLVHNVRAPDGVEVPEPKLYDHRADPLNQKNVAEENPEIVERLADQLDGWHKWALENRIATDDAAAESMSSEELEKLRSLGYVQ